MKKISCLMLMIFSLFILIGCKEENEKIEKPQDQPIEEVHQASHVMKELNLLGMASIKEFKATTQPHKVKHFITKQKQVKELSDEKPTYVPGVTYPYDYVKIHSAMKFSIFIPENVEDEALEVIKDSCGLGYLDVIIADFSTFEFDEKKEELRLGVQDTMITLVGKKGLYTILANSGRYQYDQGKTYFCEVYSSHKTIDSNSINKSSEPPFYGINVNYGYDGIYNVSFSKNENYATYDDFTLVTKYTYNATTVERVARDTMYSVLDLTSYPQEWIEGDITSINQEASYFTLRVEKDSFIDVFISKNTVFEDNTIEMDSIWEYLEIDAHIAVCYDYWYDGYEPTYIYANTFKLFS